MNGLCLSTTQAQLTHLQIGLLTLPDHAKPEFAELGPIDTRDYECGFSSLINGLVEPPVLDFLFQPHLPHYQTTVGPTKSDRACEWIVQKINNVPRQTSACSTKSSLPERAHPSTPVTR